MTRSHDGRRGQTIIMYTLASTMMFGALGLVVDFGWAFYRKQVLQSAADAAALGAGLAAYQATGGVAPTCGANGVVCSSAEVACPSTLPSTPTTNIQAGCLWAAANGVTTGGRTRVTFQSGTGNAPNASGVTINYWMVAKASEQIPQLFSAVLGKRFANVAATATIGVREASNGGCVYTMNPTQAAALRMTGTTNLTSGCGVFVNSNNAGAITAVGGGNITTLGQAKTHIVGNWSGSGTISPAPLTGEPAGSDPFADMNPPSYSGCDNAGVNLGSHDSLTITPASTTTPYVICGGINLGAQSTLRLQPGLYVVKNGISLGAQTSLIGSGVTLYVETGTVNMAGGATANLSAPTSGVWQGILFFQARTNTNDATLVGGTNQQMNGVLYFPRAHLNYTGGSGTVATATTIVSDTLQLVGNSYITASATTQYTGITGGVFLVD